MHTAQIPNLNNYRNFAYHFPFVADLTEKEIFLKKKGLNITTLISLTLFPFHFGSKAC